MNIWTVANQKGGVGKTTTAVSLGGLLAKRGLRTLLVDLDPHGSLTSYFGFDPEATEHTVYDLFRHQGRNASASVRDTPYEHLMVLPASTALATLERQLAVQQGQGLILRSVLAELHGCVDHVVIDCPPMLGMLMVNALAACDHLVVPVQTEFLALKGLERMLRTVEMVNQSLKKPLKYTIVPTMYDRRTRAGRQTLDVLQRRYEEHVWDLAIPVDTQFREASNRGVPLGHWAPHARGTLAYGALLDTLLGEESWVRGVVGYDC